MEKDKNAPNVEENRHYVIICNKLEEQTNQWQDLWDAKLVKKHGMMNENNEKKIFKIINFIMNKIKKKHKEQQLL